MIRPLRQRHRLIVCTLGVLLPVAFTAGLSARKPVAVPANVTWQFADQTSDFERVVWTKPDIWPGQRIITSLRRDATGSVAVELMSRDLAKPDVLVYWAAEKETVGLPTNARLLGALSNHAPLRIPADVRGEDGRLLLYSLADHEVVATSNPVTF